MKLRLLLGLVSLLGAAARGDDLRAVRFDQLLGARVPADAAFRDETGRAVTFQEYLGSTPIILVPGYYRCPMMCPLVTDGIIEALQDLRTTAGRDFQMIFYSVNPREALSEALAKKQMDLRQYGREGAAPGWHFLTGTEEQDRRLSDAIGYHYAYDPESKEYAHATGFVILTPRGVVTHYFFGVNYSAKELRAALLAAQGEEVGSPVERLFLLCFHYNPLTGKHSLEVMNLMRFFGLCTVAAVGLFVAKSIRGERLRAGGEDG
jgi:protein SCO1/2